MQGAARRDDTREQADTQHQQHVAADRCHFYERQAGDDPRQEADEDATGHDATADLPQRVREDPTDDPSGIGAECDANADLRAGDRA